MPTIEENISETEEMKISVQRRKSEVKVLLTARDVGGSEFGCEIFGKKVRKLTW